MAYRKPAGERARIRSLSRIEKAMKDRDISAAELAGAVKTSEQNISNIRRGAVKSVSRETAQRIEKTLRVAPGTLFEFSPVVDGVAS